MATEIDERWRSHINRHFPDLKEGLNFEFTSPVDFNYDCLSWAMSRNDVLFQKEKWAYWPWDWIPDDTAFGWSEMFKLHGYVPSSNPDHVQGVEKVAILEDEEGDLHACRQDLAGVWKSKIGDMGPDIDHADLESLAAGYGEVVYILERPRIR